MIFAGVDYSYTTPAITVYDDEQGEISFLKCKTFYIDKRKKNQKEFYGGALVGLEYPKEYSTEIERFSMISDSFINIMKEYGVEYVVLEGYAMGANNSRVFNIAENAALLKYKMELASIPYETPAPTQIKRYITGKGSGKKNLMYEEFLEQGNPCIATEMGYSSEKVQNPVSDVVDSYFMCKYALENYE